MAGQQTWGNAGDTNNAYIVVPKREKEIYVKSTYNTIVGKLNGNRKMSTQILRFGNKTQNVFVGNSSCIWETEISSGNESRITMIENRAGMPSGYGDYPVQTGNYDKYKHSQVWVNQIDSEAVPVPGRCSLKQVKDILNDPKGDALNGLEVWSSGEIDWEFLISCLMGASKNLLSTTRGGLGITLPGCSAGQTRSCWNTYVVGNGLVTQNTTRATFEASVGTALSGLSDNALYAFNYKQHNLMLDLIGSLFFKKSEVGGKSLNAVVLSDPWLIARLAATSGDYDMKMRSAFMGKGFDSPSIDSMSPIVLDDVMYIPCEQLKKFRASVSTNPIYGPGITADPRTYVNTQKICCQIWMGPGAILRATDRRMWVTAAQVDQHKDQYEYALHWDDGFVRRDWLAKDGRTEFDCDSIAVGWWFDPGVEKAFAA